MSQKPKNPSEDKEKLRNAKTKLAEMVYEARKRILEGDLEQAHDELYRFISEEKDKLGGDDSVFLLPGLFTLAQVHIIEGRLKKAEQYLNAAHWSFLKSNDKLNSEKRRQKGIVLTAEEQLSTKVSLHRTFAKLYEVKGDFKEAINQLKQSAYLESTKWGPEHPYVALNYFLLGKIFIDSGNQSAGEAFFSKVAEIWYRYLKNFFEKNSEEQQTFLIEQLSLEEAINYLTFIESSIQHIVEHFEETYDEEQTAVVFTPVMRTYYSIGLLYKIFGDDSQCEGYLKQVYRRCLRYLPEDDRKTVQIKSMLVGMNVNIDEAENQPQQQQAKEDLLQDDMEKGDDEEGDINGF